MQREEASELHKVNSSVNAYTVIGQSGDTPGDAPGDNAPALISDGGLLHGGRSGGAIACYNTYIHSLGQIGEYLKGFFATIQQRRGSKSSVATSILVSWRQAGKNGGHRVLQ